MVPLKSLLATLMYGRPSMPPMDLGSWPRSWLKCRSSLGCSQCCSLKWLSLSNTSGRVPFREQPYSSSKHKLFAWPISGGTGPESSLLFAKLSCASCGSAVNREGLIAP